MNTVFAGATCLVSCLVTCLSLTSCGSSSDPRRPAAMREPAQATSQETRNSDFISLPVKPGEPCWHARRWTVEGLAAVADVPVWMPHSTRASRKTLTGAWTCGGDTPFLTFGPVTVSYESGYRTPLDWKRKAADTGGYVATVLGRQALVDPAEGDDESGEVMLVVDGGILIRVIGDRDVPAADLVAAAASIDLRTPVVPSGSGLVH